MTRNIFLFLGTFVAGALIALVTRAALFDPHRGHEGHPAKAEYAPMVSNPLAPTPAPQSAAPSAPVAQPVPSAQPAASDPHAGHGAIKTADSTASKIGATSTAGADQPVNTICAICGMDVDPKLPTLEYQGKKIGFGCKMCAPKFKADPDRYGPAYLRNELIKK